MIMFFRLKKYELRTRSSAVAKRPRDASCLYSVRVWNLRWGPAGANVTVWCLVNVTIQGRLACGTS